MSRSICFLCIFFIFTAGTISAQNNQGIQRAALPEHGRHTLVIDIDTRVLNEEQKIIWNESQIKTGMPGIPFSVRLVGTNIILDTQFTPIIHETGNLLIALVQIWIHSQNNIITYHTSVHTIPIDLGEPFYFFPLGTSNPSIELLMTVNPYSEIHDTVVTSPN